MERNLAIFDGLKRSIFLWIIPFIVIAIFSNTLLQNRDISTFDFWINNTLLVWLLIGWFLLFKRRYIRFAETSTLALISFFQLWTFFDAVKNYLLHEAGSLGDFIIWMPLTTLFYFLILGMKRGLYYSIFIFIIHFIIGIAYINSLSTESVDSLGQFYFAYLVYTIVLYYAQHMFKTFADLEVYKKHAYVDSLTGIANRLQIDLWLDSKLKILHERGNDFSIIFFDIDHFKSVNDNYGHKVGDDILIELSQLVEDHLSNHEQFGRWGGEEFIILSAQSGTEATKLAEHLRQIVENHTFKGVGKITASFGVTHSQQGDSQNTLLNRADKGLYRSKNLGRNKVTYLS